MCACRSDVSSGAGTDGTAAQALSAGGVPPLFEIHHSTDSALRAMGRPG
jgi:hypothetical protein